MNTKQEGKLANLPNTLTGIRVAAIPLVMISLSFPGKWGSFLAGLIFTLASITDVLDGYFARRYGAVTTLGKFLDPLADKILVTVTMIRLIPMERIAVWMVILIVTREIAITGLRGIAVEKGIVIHARALGKYKTLLQTIATVGLCVHYKYYGFDFHFWGTVVLWGAVILTVWSGVEYFRQFSQVFRDQKGAGDQ